MKTIFQTILMLLFFRREAVANSDGRETAVANAWAPDDAAAEEDGGWFKISPYGVFPGKTPGRPQHFSEAQARDVVGEFNSVLGRLGRLFRGIPIYRGHPDVDPVIWPDDRRIGKIAEMQARPDGLWGRAEWNSLGAENQREGFWIYPSPRWDAPAGRARFEPDRLISVGMTNTPRIPGSEPAVHNSATETNPGTGDEPEPQTETATETNNDSDMDPKLIREKLGLAPETTDEEVFAKIDSMMEAASKAAEAESAKMAAESAATTAKTEKDGMANSLATERRRANAGIIDLALLRGTITAAEKLAWETKLADETQREGAVNAITALKPKLNTAALQPGQNRQDREQVSGMREQVANAVSELEKGGMPYQEAWLQVKKRPEFAAYFAG
jgi:hypothetical protein